MSNVTIDSYNVNLIEPIYFAPETITLELNPKCFKHVDPNHVNPKLSKYIDQNAIIIHDIEVKDITFNTKRIPMTRNTALHVLPLKHGLMNMLNMLLYMLLIDESAGLRTRAGSELHEHLTNALSTACEDPHIKNRLTEKANKLLEKEIRTTAEYDFDKIIEGYSNADPSKVTEESDGTYLYQSIIYFDQELGTVPEQTTPDAYPIADVTFKFHYND